MQDGEWLARLIPDNFDVVPSEESANASSESFGYRLLGGKTGCKMWRWMFVSQAITNLARQEYSLKKALSVLFMRSSDPGNFHNINAYAQNHG